MTSDFKINSFMVHKEVLYVSSSEGLFKIDLENQLVLDKYYNIGEGGSAVGILDSKIILCLIDNDLPSYYNRASFIVNF